MMGKEINEKKERVVSPQLKTKDEITFNNNINNNNINNNNNNNNNNNKTITATTLFLFNCNDI